MGDVFPFGPAGLIEMDVRIDAARKQVQAGGVNLFALFVEVWADIDDLVTGDRDVGLFDSAGGDDGAAPNDHRLASSSRKRLKTSSATSTSSVVTDSAGLWLTPPLQRTNNIPTSVSADITTAS